MLNNCYLQIYELKLKKLKKLKNYQLGKKMIKK